MLMPKATMDKDRDSVTRQNDVGAAWESLLM
jgi:hypothetical protein